MFPDKRHESGFTVPVVDTTGRLVGYRRPLGPVARPK